jgi:hypothetical protein
MMQIGGDGTSSSRIIVSNPENNEGIQSLLRIMGKAMNNWFHTVFKAIPKETIGTHNIKW